MIVVTGATGQLGRQIVERLLARVGASHIGVSVRDPAKASDLAALGVRVRRGDFAAPDTLAAAFEGAAQVLIVSSNARASGGDTLTQHRAAIDAVRAAGARRIVYASHMGASAASAFPPMLDHAATEAVLAECGIAWTALRNGFYAESGLMLMGDRWQSGTIAAPADGKVCWTAHADLAEAAAIMLADEGRFDGPTPPLTGSQTLDLDDLARIASELMGRPVTRETIGDDAFRASVAARGAPAAAQDVAVGLYRASRAGAFDRIDPTLERLINRPPIAMRDLIAATVG